MLEVSLGQHRGINILPRSFSLETFPASSLRLLLRQRKVWGEKEIPQKPIPVLGPMIPYRLISFILSFINVMLLLITHASDGWTTYHPEVELYNAGLWVICSDNYGCQPLRTTDVYMTITRTFMLLGLLASIIAMIWSVDWDHVIHCNFTFVPKSLMTSIFSFLAGICILVAVVVFEIGINKNMGFVHSSKKWAFYLSCAICILCFLSGGYNFLTYKLSLWGTGTSTTHVNVEDSSDKDHHKTEFLSQPSVL